MSTPAREYPGLETILRKAFDRAREGLPPDIGIGVMFSFHYGEGGGFAWLAGTARDDAISLVVEWLKRQCVEGRSDVVMAAFDRWFKK